MPRPAMPVDERIVRLGAGVLALKEVEYLGRPGQGTLAERLGGLAAAMLGIVHFLGKPFSLVELEGLLRNLTRESDGAIRDRGGN